MSGQIRAYFLVLNGILVLGEFDQLWHSQSHRETLLNT